MRIFGFVGLVLLLAIVGFLMKKQVMGDRTHMTPESMPSDLNVHTRGQQIQQDIQRSVDAAIQAPRDVPSEP